MALNTPMKIVLTVVIILLIGVGFYLLDFQKKISDLKQYDITLEGKRDQLRTSEERIKSLPDQIAKREALQKERDQLIQERLPQEDAAIFVPKFIQSLEELIALEKGITKDETMQVISIAPGQLEMPGGDKKDKGGEGPKALITFPKQPFQVNITARYSTVIHFLHQLAALRLQRLVTITRISLAPNGGAKYGESPSLNVNIPMVAYLNEGKGPADQATIK